MADHHDDILTSALDLLRSRQWAGPATNSALEKQFMHPTRHTSTINPRLILGIAGALIGCGAVAAATNPAWRSAIFGPSPEPRKVVATTAHTQPAPSDRTIFSRTRSNGPAQPQPVPLPDPVTPALEQSPVASVAAASPNESLQPGEPLELDDEADRLRQLDPKAFYQRGLAAYMERLGAGDLQGSMDVARSLRGEKTASRWWARKQLKADIVGRMASGYSLELFNAIADARVVEETERADLDLAKLAFLRVRDVQGGLFVIRADQADGGTLEMTFQPDSNGESVQATVTVPAVPTPR